MSVFKKEPILAIIYRNHLTLVWPIFIRENYIKDPIKMTTISFFPASVWSIDKFFTNGWIYERDYLSFSKIIFFQSIKKMLQISKNYSGWFFAIVSNFCNKKYTWSSMMYLLTCTCNGFHLGRVEPASSRASTASRTIAAYVCRSWARPHEMASVSRFHRRRSTTWGT